MRRAEPTLGETVVVVGTGLIGLLTLQILRANGCRIIAIDIAPARLKRASELGAAHTLNARRGRPKRGGVGAHRWTWRRRSLLTAGTRSSEPVNQAFKMTRERGRVVVVGAVGMELERADFYTKSSTCASRAPMALAATIRTTRRKGSTTRWATCAGPRTAICRRFSNWSPTKRSRVAPLITDEFSIERAPEAYQKVVKGGPETVGVLLTYPNAEREAAPDRIYRLPLSAGAGRQVSIRLVGAGQFARAVHLPN